MIKKYDAIVIGAGSGLKIVSEAAQLGLKVAIIENGPFGGTCLNRGCIPSKLFIHTSDIIETIANSAKFGINSKILSINWKSIQKRVWKPINNEAFELKKGNKNTKNIKVYEGSARFIGKKILQIGKQKITSNKIFICAGSRPFVPKIEGLENIQFYTSDNIMKISKLPKNLIIIGGGYIAAELSHFFSWMGSKVTVINRSNRLIEREDLDISNTFTKLSLNKYNVILNAQISKLCKFKKGIKVFYNQKGKNKSLFGDKLLFATGRQPNSDILNVKEFGIKVDDRNYIKVNKYLETSIPGIWALGDIIRSYMLKHSANLEADYVSNNAFNPKNKSKVDYSAMPHAIFSSPQIGSVGMTEQELIKLKIPFKKSTFKYIKTGMGLALLEKDGFVKVLANKKGKILGCHILGPHASILIHEVIIAKKANLGIKGINNSVHIHPALNEVVQRAFKSLN